MSVTASRIEPAPGAGLPGAPGRTGRWLRRVWDGLPAIVLFVAVIAFWEFAVGQLGLRQFVLPRPSAIATALVEHWTDPRYGLGPSARATLIEAMGGLAIGTTAGVVVAFAAARFVNTREVLLIIGVGAGAVPIIAFAPLLNSWFGLLNPLAKMAMAAVLVFFPVMVNVTRGLVEVEPASLELMRSYAAGEGTVLHRVRIPNALPYFFTALKLATTLSLIGAIVAEYFGGASLVLGRVIVQSASALAFDITWAAIILCAASGIAMYVAVAAIERLVIPWHASVRGDT